VHAAFADANLTDRLRIIDPGEITGFEPSQQLDVHHGLRPDQLSQADP
jgi:hypothetical protein